MTREQFKQKVYFPDKAFNDLENNLRKELMFAYDIGHQDGFKLGMELAVKIQEQTRELLNREK